MPFSPIGATITVINESGATYTITSPSFNDYVVTIIGGEGAELDYAIGQSFGALFTALSMDKASYTNP
jgi:hypothetical protein